MTDTLYSCLIDVTNANTETTSHVCPTKGGPLSSHDDCDQVSQLSSPSTTSTISSPSSSMVEVAVATYGKQPIETISHTPSLLDTKENKQNSSSIMATNGKSTELVFEATKLADSLQDYTHGTFQQHIHNIDSLKKLAMPEDCLGLDPGDYTKNLSASRAPKRRKLYTHSHQEQQEQNSTITNNTAEYVNSHTGCSSPIPPSKSAPSRSTSPCLPTSPTSIQTPSDAGDNDEPSLSFNSLKKIAESGLLPTHTPCSHCKSTDTPKWRKGPTGETTLCNACGLHYAKYLQGGPSTWKAPRKHHTKKKADHNIDPSKKTDSSSATIKARKLTKPYLKDRKKDVDSDGHDQKQLTSSSSPMVKTKKLAKDFGLRAKKVYLKAGMHSGGQGQQQLGNETLNLSRFSFPLPVHQGVFIMEKEKDFDLPLDIRQEYESGELFGWTDYSSSKKPPRYIRILHNSYVERKARKEDQNAMCVCVPQRNGYGCGEDCLNRMTFIECDSSTCPCGDQCSNQRFRKREFVKSLKVYLTDGRGWGIRTEEFIQQGTLITEYRGEIISDKTCQERRQTVYKHQKNFYFLDYHKGEVIDACSKGSEARFINHGCDPNCHIEKWSRGGEYHLGVFASKDIPAGSELFYDYNFSLFDTEALGQECRCGSTNCRGFLGKRPGQGRR